jgi:gamma-glutamylcyclotransferase (GGCT)/AIG2-like uncharacterized protein YtfP
MVKLYVYGSLRKGGYNFDRFKNGNNLNYIKTEVIKGWSLYSFGSYPAIIPGENSLTVDIVEADKDTYRNIVNMELGANYKIDTVNGYPIFVYNDNKIDKYRPLVYSGDWIKYKINEIKLKY